ncbi:hypothetical protein LIER_32679 [Lithospermum erythrorhizon]|uniref:Tf2-1-like SH3-like domain-containing protein n=1 Tax=Lithospermum erythrorhizon TaxID=34254 RepID=A0AAV3RVV7_LITER
MCSTRPKDWSKWFPLAEYWYNTNFHSSLKLTPFEALYGYRPQHLPGISYLKEVQTKAKELVQHKQQLTKVIKDNLALAHERMKKFADQSRTDKSFAIEDYVFLKLQSYRKNSIALRKHLKLAAKFYGPFKVVEKIGAMAYKL